MQTLVKFIQWMILAFTTVVIILAFLPLGILTLIMLMFASIPYITWSLCTWSYRNTIGGCPCTLKSALKEAFDPKY